MDRQALLLELRQEGKLKGKKPCFVYMRKSNGKIFDSKGGNYILTEKDGTLYFQKLGIFSPLSPKHDFEVKTKQFTQYQIIKRNSLNSIILYNKRGEYLDIHYETGTKETSSTESNLQRIIDMLVETSGLKLLEIEGEKDGQQESNN